MAPAVKKKLQIQGALQKEKLQNLRRMLEEGEILESLRMHVPCHMYLWVLNAEDDRSEARFRSFAHNVEGVDGVPGGVALLLNLRAEGYIMGRNIVRQRRLVGALGSATGKAYTSTNP